MLITPTSEKMRGLVDLIDLTDPVAIAQRGGTVTGALQFDAVKGAYLDGVNDYVRYPVGTQVFGAPGVWSVVIECTPGFEANDAGIHYFIYGSATSRLYHSAGNLLFRMGTTFYITAAYAAYAAYWKTNQRNVIVYTAINGSPKLYLNGNLVVTTNIQVTAENLSSLYVGSDNSGSGKFLGHIHSIKFFKGTVAADLLTAGEAASFYDRSTYTFRSRAICCLPMGAEQHDPVNNLVRDTSGRGNHFTLGDGTAATKPTKLATRGYSFDGGDYLKANYNIINGTPWTACMLVSITGSNYLFGAYTGAAEVRVNKAIGTPAVLFTTLGAGDVYTYDNKISTNATTIVNDRALSFITFSDTDCAYSSVVNIMSRYNNSGPATGNVYYFSLYPFVLTYLQRFDEYQYALQNLGKI
ncbi:MAG: hypothetical protein WC505_06810 [Patescibacteria group bacterium]